MSLCWVGGMNCAAALARRKQSQKEPASGERRGTSRRCAIRSRERRYETRRSTHRCDRDSCLGASEILRPDRPATPRLETPSKRPEDSSRKPSENRPLQGAAMDAYNLAKSTQKKKITGSRSPQSALWAPEPRARYQGQGRRCRRRVSHATSLRRLRKTALNEARKTETTGAQRTRRMKVDWSPRGAHHRTTRRTSQSPSFSPLRMSTVSEQSHFLLGVFPFHPRARRTRSAPCQTRF